MKDGDSVQYLHCGDVVNMPYLQVHTVQMLIRLFLLNGSNLIQASQPQSRKWARW